MMGPRGVRLLTQDRRQEGDLNKDRESVDQQTATNEVVKTVSDRRKNEQAFNFQIVPSPVLHSITAKYCSLSQATKSKFALCYLQCRAFFTSRDNFDQRR
jgi:hypothetical protein